MKSPAIRPTALAAILLALAAPTALAQSNNTVTFSFAPPPITEVVAPNESANRINFTYLEVDVPNNPIRGIGLDYVGRRAGAERFGLSYTLRGLGLSDENGTMSGGMLGGSIGPEIYLGEGRNTILFAGLSMDVVAFTVTGPGFEARTAGVTGGLQAGLQHHFKFSNSFSLIPYVVFGTTSSSFTTTSEVTVGGNTFESTSDSTSSSTTTTIGFDLTFSDISIGALANTGGDNDVTMLRFGFKF